MRISMWARAKGVCFLCFSKSTEERRREACEREDQANPQIPRFLQDTLHSVAGTWNCDHHHWEYQQNYLRMSVGTAPDRVSGKSPGWEVNPVLRRNISAED